MRLRYFYRPHRWREVAPRRHPVPDLVQIVLQIGFEVLDGTPVHPRCTLIVLDLLPPASVLNPPAFGRKDSPSRRPGGAAVSGHAFSRSIRAQPGRAHVASMPDTTWPINGHPPGSSRDRVQTPVLVSTVPISTLHRQ